MHKVPYENLWMSDDFHRFSFGGALPCSAGQSPEVGQDPFLLIPLLFIIPHHLTFSFDIDNRNVIK
jgi:hypothetical protein